MGKTKDPLLSRFKPSPPLGIDKTAAAGKFAMMLTFEDHRQLAERCIRLAKASSQPKVAEYLIALAANYLDLAELALRLHRPTPAEQRQHIRLVKKTENACIKATPRPTRHLTG